MAPLPDAREKKKKKNVARKSLLTRANVPETVERKASSVRRIEKLKPYQLVPKRSLRRANVETSLEKNLPADDEPAESTVRRAISSTKLDYITNPEPEQVMKEGGARSATRKKEARKLPSDDKEIVTAEKIRVEGRGVSTRKMKLARELSPEAEEIATPEPKRVEGKALSRSVSKVKRERKLSPDVEEAGTPEPRQVKGRASRSVRRMKMTKKLPPGIEEIHVPEPKPVEGISSPTRANVPHTTKMKVSSGCRIKKLKPKEMVPRRSLRRANVVTTSEKDLPADDEPAESTLRRAISSTKLKDITNPEPEQVVEEGGAHSASRKQMARKLPSADEEIVTRETTRVEGRGSGIKMQRDFSPDICDIPPPPKKDFPKKAPRNLHLGTPAASDRDSPPPQRSEHEENVIIRKPLIAKKAPVPKSIGKKTLRNVADDEPAESPPQRANSSTKLEKIPTPEPEQVVGKGGARSAVRKKEARKLPSDDEEIVTPEATRVEGRARSARRTKMARQVSPDAEKIPTPEPKQVEGKGSPRRENVETTFEKNLPADDEPAESPPQSATKLEKIPTPEPEQVVGKGGARSAARKKEARNLPSKDEEIVTPEATRVEGRARSARRTKMARKFSPDAEKIPTPEPKQVEGKALSRSFNKVKRERKLSPDVEEARTPEPRQVKGRDSRLVCRGKMARKLPPAVEEIPTSEPKPVEGESVARTHNSMKTARKLPPNDEELPTPEPKHVAGKAGSVSNMEMTTKVSSNVEETQKPEPEVVVESVNTIKLSTKLPSDAKELDNSNSTSVEEVEYTTSAENVQEERSMESDVACVAIVKPTLKKTIPAAKGKGKSKPTTVAGGTPSPDPTPAPSPAPSERAAPSLAAPEQDCQIVRILTNNPAGYPPLGSLVHHLPSRDRGRRVAEGVYVINPPSSVVGVAVGFIILDPFCSVERKEKMTYTSVYTVLSGNPEFKLSGGQASETGKPGSMFTNIPGATVQLIADNKEAVISFSTIMLETIS